MEVNFAFLCDYADQTGGKLHALGIGIDTIYAAKTPATHRHFFAVIGLQFSSVEVGQKEVGVRLIDADGTNVVAPVDATVNVEPPASGYSYRSHRINLGFHNVTFPNYGDYAVSWLVGGQEVKRVALRFASPPTAPGTV